jgi:hypothetical protein
MRLSRLLLLAAVGCGSSPSTPDASANPWQVVSNFDQGLYGVWATGSDVFLVGYEGTSYHSSDGITFPAVPLDANITRGERIWGTSATDVYATGYGATDGGMDHSTDLGASWQPVTTPATDRLYSTWGSAGDLYVVGPGVALQSADGVTWQEQSVPIAYSGVWGSADDDIYVVGNGGIAHSTGNGVWTVQDTSTQLFSVWGSSATDIYVVGQPGVLHSDGTGNWTVQSGCTGLMLSVWGASASDISAVGAAGTICHSTGDGTWTAVESGTQLDLFGIAGTGSATYAVGGDENSSGPGILLRSP